MKESVFLRFLYRTVPGRYLLKLLVQPSVSRAAAWFLSSAASRPLIGYYIRKYKIDMTEFGNKKFRSFNDFFTRKKELHICPDEPDLISPCDGYLSVYHIGDDLHMQIKHSTYTVGELLESHELAESFRGGTCCVFRLEPQHYHRYIYPVNGTIQEGKKIPGVLHCVRPIACSQFPVYVRNSREYVLIQHDTLGSVVQMEVGAMLVGRIHNHRRNVSAKQGMEKGYFEYGGSTIILLFRKDSVQLLPQFNDAAGTEQEIPIKLGQAFGRILPTL